MQVDDEAWADVRAAYGDASVPLKEIAARFGMTTQRIVARARKDGWQRGAAGAAGAAPTRRRSGTRSAPSEPTARLPTRTAQKAVIGRLYRAITLKLEHMEKRMASGEVRSAQDEERESRALATLISNFEKVTEAVAELDRERNAVRAGGASGTDAERMRREIAERLERLGCGGAARRGPGEPGS